MRIKVLTGTRNGHQPSLDEHEGAGWVVTEDGHLAIRDEDRNVIHVYAPGHWSEVARA